MISKQKNSTGIFFDIKSINFGKKKHIPELMNSHCSGRLKKLKENGFSKFNSLTDEDNDGNNIDVGSIIESLLSKEYNLPEHIYLCSETVFSRAKRPVRIATDLSESLFAYTPLEQVPISLVCGGGCANISRALAQFQLHSSLTKAWIIAIEVCTTEERVFGEKGYLVSDGAILMEVARTPFHGAFELKTILQQTTHGISAYQDGSIKFIKTHQKHTKSFCNLVREATAIDLKKCKNLISANYSEFDMRFYGADLDIDMHQLYRPTLEEHGHIVSIDIYLNLIRYNEINSTRNWIPILSIANYFWDFVLVKPYEEI